MSWVKKKLNKILGREGVNKASRSFRKWRDKRLGKKIEEALARNDVSLDELIERLLDGDRFRRELSRAKREKVDQVIERSIMRLRDHVRSAKPSGLNYRAYRAIEEIIEGDPS